ncbi:MAG: transcriptional repressor [Actinomycetota bacterium]
MASLRLEGGRATVQRRAVITALLGAPRHVTAEELIDSIHRDNPEVASTTVYRTLDALERQGIVQHAHLGHGPAVYHLTDEEHLHLVCESCGVVTEVPRRFYNRFEQTVAREFHFLIEPHHFAVHGHCTSCAGKPALPHSGNRSGPPKAPEAAPRGARPITPGH